MKELREKAEKLLRSGEVQMIIGYGAGTGGRVRPIFLKDPASAQQLIFDDRCNQNLAVYVSRHEVKRSGKAAVVSNVFVLRTILQLAAENQIEENAVYPLAVTAQGEVVELPTFQRLEEYLKSHDPVLAAADREEMARLDRMTHKERWDYWQSRLSRCIKCYACRAACPLCYCGRCAVECNQPQWVSVPSHDAGNFEWHVTRAMHLAGRCTGCGECARACPLDIPVDMLTKKLNETVSASFHLRGGVSMEAGYALSSFKPDDKESFIR